MRTVLLGLGALLLLPGLLVVRAPWTAVPALSLGFWALSAWWPPLAGLSRGRVVDAFLLCSALLALLRALPKHEVPPPPGWVAPDSPPPIARPSPPPLRCPSSAAVALVGLLLLAPLPLWHHAPGERLAFQTTMARVLLWRDGVPRSAEPLLPLAPVGAHGPAVATLAADLSRLSGVGPGRSVLAVTLAAAGLTLVGLFALLATWLEPRAAALSGLLTLAVLPWPGVFLPWGEGESLLALAFLLPAAALVLGHRSRSSALAAGLLLGAAALAHPLLAVLTTLSLTVAVTRQSLPARSRRLRRLLAAALLGLLLSAPGLVPLARALSGRELLMGLGSSLRTADLAAVAWGLLAAVLGLFVAVRLCALRSRRARVQAALLGCVSGLLLLVRVHAWVGAGQLDPAAQAALARAARGSPVEPVCAPPRLLSWVPALAGRPAGQPGPWIPAVYADEWRHSPRPVCHDRLEGVAPP
jgi:hypothetical protein